MASPRGGRDGPGGGVLSLTARRGGEDNGAGVVVGPAVLVVGGRRLWFGARFLAGKILGI